MHEFITKSIKMDEFIFKSIKWTSSLVHKVDELISP